MIISCPHCKILVDTDQAAYVEDDLILCEHCGNEFLAPPDPRRDPRTAPPLLPEEPAPRLEPPPPEPPPPEPPPPAPPPATPPRIVITADDVPGHPLAEHAAPRADARRPGAAATLAWAFGILLLLVALAGQYVYFMRDQLALHPPLRPWIEKLCAYAGCQVPLVHAPEQIRVMARDVRRHPAVTDGLMVSVTFANEAPFRQTYPVIQLSFFDMRDQVMARRSFVPAEYLPHGIDPAAGMAAGSAVQATLEIVDPGANAVNFTLEFH